MTLFVFDSFDGTANDLTAHVGQVGAVWTRHPSFPYDAAKYNQWRVSGAGSTYSTVDGYGAALLIAAGKPAGSEYDLRCRAIFRGTLPGDQACGVVFRCNPAANTYWRLTYETYTAFRRWTLSQVLAGTATVLGTYSDAVVDGDVRDLLVKVRDTGVTANIGGADRLSSTDAIPTGGDRVGLYAFGSGQSSATAGVHFDMFATGTAGFALPAYAYNVTGPDGGPPGFDSTAFTVALTTGVNPGTLTVTPVVAGMTGTVTPTTVTLTDAHRTQTFLFRPAAVGTATLSFANGSALEDSPALSYASAFLPPEREAYWASQLYTRSSAGPTPYVAGATAADGSGGYWLDGDDHYDPALGFRKIQDYSVRKGLAVTDYSVQIAAAITRFRDRAVRATGGPPEGPGVTEYHRYLTGIARHYLETGSTDAADVEAADILSPTTSPARYPALYGHSGLYRESAFVLLTCLDREWMGLGAHALTDVAARVCLDQDNDICRPVASRRYGVYLKPFMGALNMMALIRYWEMFRSSTDPTKATIVAAIPPAVKALCGYIWDEAWFPAGANHEWSPGAFWDKGSIAYRDVPNDDPRYVPIPTNAITAVVNPRSIIRGPATLSTVDGYYNNTDFIIDGWADTFGVESYVGATRQLTLKSPYLPSFDMTTSHTFTLRPADWKDPSQGEGNGPSPDLNHMVSPAFAWCYWHERTVLGNAEASKHWRTKFHTLFDSSIQSWSPAGSQKIYNQSAYWTTDGLDWASLGDAAAATPATIDNVLLIPSPAGGILMCSRPGN